MTANELISLMNRTFGVNPWPKTFEVDADTYANCCQFIFNKQPLIQPAAIHLGFTQNGLMFKNVELILQGYKK